MWQNQTHSISRGGRTIGGVEATVRSAMRGIHSWSYLHIKTIRITSKWPFIVKKSHPRWIQVLINHFYSWKQYLRMDSRMMDFWWSQSESATSFKNPRLCLAAATRSTLSFTVSSSDIPLRLLIDPTSSETDIVFQIFHMPSDTARTCSTHKIYSWRPFKACSMCIHSNSKRTWHVEHLIQHRLLITSYYLLLMRQ